MNYLIGALVALALSGCTFMDVFFKRPDATPQMLAHDSYECHLQVRHPQSGFLDPRLLTLCLEGRGYVRVK
jgi:hypothetical protein